MKKLIFILLIIWFGLNAFAKSVNASDYTKAVVSHVIQSKVNGEEVDHGKLLENDSRSPAEHIKDNHKLIYLLIHPDTYYNNHFYE